MDILHQKYNCIHLSLCSFYFCTFHSLNISKPMKIKIKQKFISSTVHIEVHGHHLTPLLYGRHFKLWQSHSWPVKIEKPTVHVAACHILSLIWKFGNRQTICVSVTVCRDALGFSILWLIVHIHHKSHSEAYDTLVARQKCQCL